MFDSKNTDAMAIWCIFPLKSMFLLAFDVVEHGSDQVCVRLPCLVILFAEFIYFIFLFPIPFFSCSVWCSCSCRRTVFNEFRWFLSISCILAFLQKWQPLPIDRVIVCVTHGRKCQWKKVKNRKWLQCFVDGATCEHDTQNECNGAWNWKRQQQKNMRRVYCFQVCMWRSNNRLAQNTDNSKKQVKIFFELSHSANVNW